MNASDLLTNAVAGNALTRWLIAVIVGAATALVLLVIRRLVVNRLGRLAAITENRVDDIAIDLVGRTRNWFFLILGVYAGSLTLSLAPELRRGLSLATVLALLLQSALWGNALIATWLRAYAARRAEDAGSATAIHALGYLLRVFLWGVIVLMALENLGINITTLIAGLGVGGIAVALAVQNVLGDLFGALAIVLDKPFVVGDAIVVDQVEGDVEHVGLKTTRIRSINGEQVIIANAELLKSRIRNYKRLSERRVVLPLLLVMETPAETVARVPGLVEAIVRARPNARFARSHVKRIAESGIEIETVFHVTRPDYLSFMETQQAVVLDVLRMLEREGIRLAYPTRTIVGAAPPAAAAT